MAAEGLSAKQDLAAISESVPCVRISGRWNPQEARGEPILHPLVEKQVGEGCLVIF